MERRIDLNLFEALIDSLETACSTAGGRAGMANWICKNTSSPKDPLKPFSFEKHEFQVRIVEDQSPHIAVQKPAQRGVSEIVARFVLGLAAKMRGENFIYILPSAQFARTKFVPGRIDPIIEASPRLKKLVSKTINNTELKQIGSSFLHVAGAHSENQAISVPARGLFVDEQSFCSPEILSTYKSRLEHNERSERILFEFSTPLFPGFGISEVVDSGTGNVYMTFHDACGQWVVINSMECIVIPGYDDKLEELTVEILKRGSVKGGEAWVKCPHCGSSVSQQNMADPAKRAWVPARPGREISSYQIDALDMAAIKFAPDVIGALKIYRNTTKWIQFGLGYPFLNSDVSITPEALENAFTVRPGDAVGVTGAVLGTDVGNLSHISCGKKLNNSLEVFRMETVKQTGDNALGTTFVDLYNKYNASQGVIDAGPDVTVCKYARQQLPVNRCWGGQFVRGVGKTLEVFDKDEEKGVLRIKRTPAINEFVKDFNSGAIKLPMGLPFEKDIKEHLGRPKRVTNTNAVGEEASVWVSGPENHWFFSLFYMWMAAKLAEVDSRTEVAPGLVIASKVKLGGALQPASSRFDPMNRRYAA